MENNKCEYIIETFTNYDFDEKLIDIIYKMSQSDKYKNYIDKEDYPSNWYNIIIDSFAAYLYMIGRDTDNDFMSNYVTDCIYDIIDDDFEFDEDSFNSQFDYYKEDNEENSYKFDASYTAVKNEIEEFLNFINNGQ